MVIIIIISSSSRVVIVIIIITITITCHHIALIPVLFLVTGEKEWGQSGGAGCYLPGFLGGPGWGWWEGSSSAGRRAPWRWGRSWWSRLQGCCWWCRELGPSSARWTPGSAREGPAVRRGRAALCSWPPPCGEHTKLLLGLLCGRLYHCLETFIKKIYKIQMSISNRKQGCYSWW